MISNRSMPTSIVIPVLHYPDVIKSVEWLCKAFGFTVRIKIGNHRVQLNVGEASIVITSLEETVDTSSPVTHSVMIRVDQIDEHFKQVLASNPEVIQPLTDQVYGERQYTVKDPYGHVWTFSQSIKDVDPLSWGGIPINLNTS